MTECAELPKGQHDDLADAMSQALAHLRSIGLATLPDEDEMDHIDDDKYKRPAIPLYPAMA